MNGTNNNSGKMHVRIVKNKILNGEKKKKLALYIVAYNDRPINQICESIIKMLMH